MLYDERYLHELVNCRPEPGDICMECEFYSDRSFSNILRNEKAYGLLGEVRFINHHSVVHHADPVCHKTDSHYWSECFWNEDFRDAIS